MIPLRMNKGVYMIMRIKRAIITALTFIMIIGIGWGQSGGYLAQKLMVENSLRKRITDALEKIIDNRKYVVDVSVDLELSSAVEEQTTFKSGAPTPSDYELDASKLESTSKEGQNILPSSGVGLPIPGFDFDTEDSRPLEEPVSSNDIENKIESGWSSDNVLSRTHTEKHPALAKIRNIEISIILQEGAAPELIENIRQVVMVASRFNRARGDVLSIMTASFKERRDEKTAEQVLLKSIAEKLESLETQRERLGEVDWKEELANYKQEEADRRQEDRLYFQSKLTELESSARDRAYEQQKQDILRGDSVRLNALNEEIQNLKAFLGAGGVSDSAVTEAESSIQKKLGEKSNLDQQIAEKLAMLETVQEDLDRQGGYGNTAMIIFIAVLGALVIVLIVVLAFVLMNKPKQQMMPPPPWMYPPRPKKKSDNGTKKSVKKPDEAVQSPPSKEDIAVLQSEVNDMKQAVVSMSVGQPSAAQKIVKEWIQEEAPTEQEQQAPTEQAPEDESGKNKKKKK